MKTQLYFSYSPSFDIHVSSSSFWLCVYHMSCPFTVQLTEKIKGGSLWKWPNTKGRLASRCFHFGSWFIRSTTLTLGGNDKTNNEQETDGCEIHDESGQVHKPHFLMKEKHAWISKALTVEHNWINYPVPIWQLWLIVYFMLKRFCACVT